MALLGVVSLAVVPDQSPVAWLEIRSLSKGRSPGAVTGGATAGTCMPICGIAIRRACIAVNTQDICAGRYDR